MTFLVRLNTPDNRFFFLAKTLMEIGR